MSKAHMKHGIGQYYPALSQQADTGKHFQLKLSQSKSIKLIFADICTTWVYVFHLEGSKTMVPWKPRH